MKDEKLPINSEVENIDGVIEAGGQYQVVVGQAVADIYKEVQMQLTGSDHEMSDEPKPVLTKKGKIKTWFDDANYQYSISFRDYKKFIEGGAVLAVAIKSKNPKIKELGYAGAISAFSGITETAIYGINLRFRKPFIMASIASAVGGFLTGVFNINMWSIILLLIRLTESLQIFGMRCSLPS